MAALIMIIRLLIVLGLLSVIPWIAFFISKLIYDKNINRAIEENRKPRKLLHPVAVMLICYAVEIIGVIILFVMNMPSYKTITDSGTGVVEYSDRAMLTVEFFPEDSLNDNVYSIFDGRTVEGYDLVPVDMGQEGITIYEYTNDGSSGLLPDCIIYVSADDEDATITATHFDGDDETTIVDHGFMLAATGGDEPLSLDPQALFRSYEDSDIYGIDIRFADFGSTFYDVDFYLN
ncbi:MAG: hypothetical protein J5685_09880 [Clostridiales bacterium]|nr:hypothetical protein [Clostridiales bacterium]